MAKEKTKLCIVTDPYELPIRGRVNGPILSPSEFTMSELRSLLVARFNVYEVNPHNRSEKTKLTFANLNNDNYMPIKKHRNIKKSAPPKSVFTTRNPLRDRALGKAPVTTVVGKANNINGDNDQNASGIELVESPDFF